MVVLFGVKEDLFVMLLRAVGGYIYAFRVRPAIPLAWGFRAAFVGSDLRDGDATGEIVLAKGDALDARVIRYIWYFAVLPRFRLALHFSGVRFHRTGRRGVAF